jgi:hypothetical protein
LGVVRGSVIGRKPGAPGAEVSPRGGNIEDLPRENFFVQPDFDQLLPFRMDLAKALFRIVEAQGILPAIVV